MVKFSVFETSADREKIYQLSKSIGVEIPTFFGFLFFILVLEVPTSILPTDQSILAVRCIVAHPVEGNASGSTSLTVEVNGCVAGRGH